MKLIVERAAQAQATVELPTGVSLLGKVGACSFLVEADVHGEVALRASRDWSSVRKQVMVDVPRAVDPTSVPDVLKAASDARARLARARSKGPSL